MSDSSDTKITQDGYVCSWCGARFQSAASQKTPVCPHCYGLLCSAGLKDEEIFAGEKPGKNEGGSDD